MGCKGSVDLQKPIKKHSCVKMSYWGKNKDTKTRKGGEKEGGWRDSEVKWRKINVFMRELEIKGMPGFEEKEEA